MLVLLYHNFYSLDIANDFYSKLVGKEMHLYKIYPKERTSYLQLLYKALMTIKPTSVEAKRAFSAMGFFVTKLRNRMSDKTLDALITMRQHYKKLINPLKMTVIKNKKCFNFRDFIIVFKNT